MKNNGNRRVTGKEQYYTRLNIATDCVQFCIDNIDSFYEMKFCEPAGGSGHFIEALMDQGIPSDSIFSVDIEPLHPLVTKADFLGSQKILSGYTTISNPPFGRANSLSKKFFNHAASLESSYIAFLIPKSWRKWSIINSLDSRYFLLKDMDLPAECFETKNGIPYKNTGGLKCIFQIWKKYARNNRRPKIIVEDHGFISKTTPNNADVALTIFGWGAGRVETEFDRVPNTTKIFLKVKDISVVEALKSIDYSKFYENVAYIPALSLSEINSLLNEYYKLKCIII